MTCKILCHLLGTIDKDCPSQPLQEADDIRVAARRECPRQNEHDDKFPGGMIVRANHLVRPDFLISWPHDVTPQVRLPRCAMQRAKRHKFRLKAQIQAKPWLSSLVRLPTARVARSIRYIRRAIHVVGRIACMGTIAIAVARWRAAMSVVRPVGLGSGGE